MAKGAVRETEAELSVGSVVQVWPVTGGSGLMPPSTTVQAPGRPPAKSSKKSVVDTTSPTDPEKNPGASGNGPPLSAVRVTMSSSRSPPQGKSPAISTWTGAWAAPLEAAGRSPKATGDPVITTVPEVPAPTTTSARTFTASWAHAAFRTLGTRLQVSPGSITPSPFPATSASPDQPADATCSSWLHR